jgi:hypothetical protein
MDERAQTANPWLYMHQRFDQEMASAGALADREKYYQVCIDLLISLEIAVISY